MTTTMSPLAPRLSAALVDVHVAPGGLSAGVGTATFAAETPQTLVKKLAAGLYELLHVGRDEPTPTRPRSYRDRELDRLFAAAVPHTTSASKGVVRTAGEDGTVVDLGGLLVRVPARAVIVPAAPGQVARIAVPAARPALSPGFFLVDGSAGNEAGSPDTLRVYVHLTDPEHGVAVWQRALALLEEAGLPYRAKISSSRLLYPRRDALVVYLGPRARHAAGDLARALSGMPGVGGSTSVLAREVAPGVAVAWEPADPRRGRAGLSFGEHRTAAIAEALVQRAVEGEEEDVPAEVAVASALLDAGADPLDPARNLSSPPLADLAGY